MSTFICCCANCGPRYSGFVAAAARSAISRVSFLVHAPRHASRPSDPTGKRTMTLNGALSNSSCGRRRTLSRGVRPTSASGTRAQATHPTHGPPPPSTAASTRRASVWAMHTRVHSAHPVPVARAVAPPSSPLLAAAEGGPHAGPRPQHTRAPISYRHMKPSLFCWCFCWLVVVCRSFCCRGARLRPRDCVTAGGGRRRARQSRRCRELLDGGAQHQ